MIGDQFKHSKTGEVVKIVNEREITITIYDVESSYGTHPKRTRVVGKSDLIRLWELVK